ncbi:MAG: glycerol kinase, partial [Akkermansiaceae bacterium]|nr:glycerol kinase [Akkermansiaceae bacterium]
GVAAGDLAAIGITNQRETTLVWDAASGEAVGRAIVWQDRRTADRCAALKADGFEEVVTARTGLRLDPYFSGTKLEWILQNVPGAGELARAGKLRFGTVDAWLVWNLTGGGVHVTDVSNASRTMLFDIHKMEWDEELLEKFGVPGSVLPKVVASSGVVGEWNGVPVAGIAGDQQAALFGQACFEPGMAKNTYGTGCFLLKNTGREAVRSSHGLLTTVGWTAGKETAYALEGSVFIGGALFQWLRDELQIVGTAPEVDALAASVPDSGGCMLVPAFAGLGAPHWDPYARGAMFGLTRGTSKAHLCRAALEAVALQSAEVLDCMERDSGVTLMEMRADGGAARSDLLMQIQADVLQRPVVRPKNIETTAFGAAALAGLATGVWNSRDALRDDWEVDRIFEPSISTAEAAEKVDDWSRAVELVRQWKD